MSNVLLAEMPQKKCTTCSQPMHFVNDMWWCDPCNAYYSNEDPTLEDYIPEDALETCAHCNGSFHPDDMSPDGDHCLDCVDEYDEEDL
jgi:hypothetical protein